MSAPSRYRLVVRLNGTDAAFLPVYRSRTRAPRICSSVSLFLFEERRRIHHTLLDVGPGVPEAIQALDAFPAALPLDWLIISHSHIDHFIGLDTLCGDYHTWARVRGLPPPRIKLHCLPATLAETVGTHFPFHLGRIDHSAAQPGQPHTLWRGQDAELQVTLVEVRHFKQSVVSIFTFTVANEPPVRVVCLFDFGGFHPPDSPQAQAGSRADHPLFQRPDLLIAEATNWGDQSRPERPDTHLSFERLAEFILHWQPLQTRVIHYAGVEDLWRPGDAGAYLERLEQGLHLHPSAGPVAAWEMAAAMQEHLHQVEHPNPRSVWLGYPGEALLVFPRVERAPVRGDRL